MGLTKAQRIEIQESAKFNYDMRKREKEERLKLEEAIQARINEPTEVVEKPVESDAAKKKG